MKDRITIRNLFQLGILIEILFGMKCWFTWYMSPVVQLLIFSIISLVSYQYVQVWKVKLYNSPAFLLLMLILFLVEINFVFNIGSLAMYVAKYYPLWVLLSDRDNINLHVSVITKNLSIILLPGLILHVLMLFVGIIPVNPIIHPRMEVYRFYNYIVLLKGSYIYEADGIRFQSIALESGYLGTFLAFWMYVLRFNLKKKANQIILVLLIFSLSLAGYVLAFIGYLFYVLSQGKKVKQILMFCILFITTYLGGIYYNNGHNYLNERIIERLQPDDEKIIAGNNRVGDATKDYFDYFTKTDKLMLGIGASRIEKLNGTKDIESDFQNFIGGAGYMIYIIRYGIISVLFVAIFYLSFIFFSPIGNRFYMLGFFVLVFIAFLQASYPLSQSWLVPYLTTFCLNRKKEICP